MSSDIRPSVLTTGSQSLRSYEKDGVHRQAAGLSPYFRFVASNVDANAAVNFFMEDDIQLLSVYMNLNPNYSLPNGSTIRVRAYDWGNPTSESLLLSLVVPANPLNLGSLVLWEPRFLAVQKNWTVTFTASFSYERMFFYGTPIYVEKEFLGAVIAQEG